MPLQGLEQSDAIRWADIYAGDLDRGEALALLGPVCRGELNTRMVRDLITPRRFPAGREYLGTGVSITAGFRTRHLQEEGDEPSAVTSIFEPVHLLLGHDWLISCWLPPRVFRGDDDGVFLADDVSEGLYFAVADSWLDLEGETAADLASLVRRELAIAAGYRVQAQA